MNSRIEAIHRSCRREHTALFSRAIENYLACIASRVDLSSNKRITIKLAILFRLYRIIASNRLTRADLSRVFQQQHYWATTYRQRINGYNYSLLDKWKFRDYFEKIRGYKKRRFCLYSSFYAPQWNLDYYTNVHFYFHTCAADSYFCTSSAQHFRFYTGAFFFSKSFILTFSSGLDFYFYYRYTFYFRTRASYLYLREILIYLYTFIAKKVKKHYC